MVASLADQRAAGSTSGYAGCQRRPAPGRVDLPGRRLLLQAGRLDEPTAALGVQETARVEELVLKLRNEGMTILLISHNFEQVLRLADQVQVMRAGRTRRPTPRTSETDGQELVGLVTGAITRPRAPAPDAQPLDQEEPSDDAEITTRSECTPSSGAAHGTRPAPARHHHARPPAST